MEQREANVILRPFSKLKLEVMEIVIPGPPMGAPRQNRSDRWKQRPAVMRYRAWKDHARACVLEQVGDLPNVDRIFDFSWVAYFAPPESWSDIRRAKAIGTLHRHTPDRDNVEKCVLDTLFERDEGIAWGTIGKVWDLEPRLEIKIEYQALPEAVAARLPGRAAA